MFLYTLKEQLNGLVGMSDICYIAAAGAGKTTYIIHDVECRFAKNDSEKLICVVTYTTHNQQKTIERLQKRFGNRLPSKIMVIGWYKFLLDFIIKPYKGDIIEDLYEQHVGFQFVEHDRGLICHASSYSRRKFSLKDKFLLGNNIDSQHVSEFAWLCIKKNKRNIAKRFGAIFEAIYFDEAQDFVGYDYDVISTIIKSSVDCMIMADPRQHTYSSNNGARYKKYAGKPDLFFDDKLNAFKKHLISIDYSTLNVSHRCSRIICDFASKLYNDYPATEPCLCPDCKKREEEVSCEKGIFLLLEKDLENFIKRNDPLELHWKNSSDVTNSLCKRVMNMGESKGDEDNVVLIYPTNTFIDWISLHKPLHMKSKAIFYVAITRARYCVAIVLKERLKKNYFNLPYWGEKYKQLSLF